MGTTGPMSMWAAVVFAVGTMFGGCNQSPVPDDEEDDEPDETVSCSVDADCDSYFRCLEGTCSTPPAMTGEHDESTPVAEFYGQRGEPLVDFHLELAVTADQRSRGLMHRPEMRSEWGMLFVYPNEQTRSFWMKNTLIPLDMIFVDAGGEVVGVVREAEPETLESRGVGRPSRYVLEIKGGLAEEHGIEQGAKMRLQNVEPGYEPDD